MQIRMRALCVTLSFVGLLVGMPNSAWGQDDDTEQGGGVINLQETVIEGNIQKPEAFYILQHSNLSYESLEPKPSFIPKLLESAEEEPF